MALVTRKDYTVKDANGKDINIGYKFELDDLKTSEKEALDRTGLTNALRQMDTQVLLLTNPKEYAEKRRDYAVKLTKNLVDQYESDFKAFYEATGDAEASKAAAERKMAGSTAFLSALVERAYPGLDEAAKILSSHLVANKTGINSKEHLDQLP